MIETCPTCGANPLDEDGEALELAEWGERAVRWWNRANAPAKGNP